MNTLLFLALGLVTRVPVHALVKHTARRGVQPLHLPWILLLCISCATRAQVAAEPPFTLKQVGPNVWAAISNPKSKAPAGANTGFVIGDDGVVIIDTSASEALPPPTVTYDQSVELHIGSREMRLRSKPAGVRDVNRHRSHPRVGERLQDSREAVGQRSQFAPGHLLN
jgi:hypothetical protein